MTIKVTVTVERDGKAASYQLDEVGESKGGNYKLFQAKASADLPDFGKMYVNAKRANVKEAKVKKS